jgi:Skp family chaperone for outer membrane proteins
MKKTSALVLIIFYGLGASAQEKPGYFDYEKVIQSLNTYPSFIAQQENLTKTYQDSLQLLANQLHNFMSYGIPHHWSPKPEERKLLQDSLSALQNYLYNFPENAIEKIERSEDSLRIFLNIDLETQLKFFCTERKICCMAVKKAVLYCPSCIDFTEQLIKYLQEKK